MTRIFYILALLALAAMAPAGAEGVYRGGKVAPPSSFSEAPAAKEWNWSGVFLDLGVGGQAALMDLSAGTTQGEGGLNAGLSGLGAWDWVGNARIGAAIQPQGSPLVYGAFVGYSLGSVTIEGNLSNGVESAGLQAEITPTWDAGAFVGIVGPNKSLLYGGYKFQMAELDVRGTGQAADMVKALCAEALRCNHDLNGHGLIAGFKMPVTPAFVLGIEYGYTRFDDAELSRTEGLRATLEPEVHSVMLRGQVLIGPNLFGN